MQKKITKLVETNSLLCIHLFPIPGYTSIINDYNFYVVSHV